MKRESTRWQIKEKIGTKCFNGQITDFDKKFRSNYIWK